jgi:hypothetical protein
MAEDLPRLAPPRDEADRRLRALLGILAGGEAGATFAGNLGLSNVEAAIRSGIAEANPDYVTVGQIGSPIGQTSMLGNAAAEIGIGIKNWWTGYDEKKPKLMTPDEFYSTRGLTTPKTLEDAIAAAEAAVRASPAFIQLTKPIKGRNGEYVPRSATTKMEQMLQNARDAAEKTYIAGKTERGGLKATLDTEYDNNVAKKYDRDMEAYNARGFEERLPGLAGLLPIAGTAAAAALTRGAFKKFNAKQADNAAEVRRLQGGNDAAALAAARAEAEAYKRSMMWKKPGIAAGAATLPADFQLMGDMYDYKVLPPEYQTSDGTWKASKAFERAERRLSPIDNPKEFANRLIVSGVSGLAGTALGAKMGGNATPVPHRVSTQELMSAKDELADAMRVKKELEDLRAQLARPAPSNTLSAPSNTATPPPIPPTTGTPAQSPSRPATSGAAQSQKKPPTYGPPQNQKSQAIIEDILDKGEPFPSVQELTKRVRQDIGKTGISDKSLMGRAQGTRDEADALKALGVDIYDPAIRQALIDRLAPGKPGMLAVPLAVPAGLGALDDREEFANGGSVGEPVTVGPLHSRVPGRTDALAITVPEGAFVIPADVVAYLGEGNSTAGLDRVSDMFPSPRALRANGGTVPIAAAGGEYVLSPETVMEIGGGDLKRGHNALDSWVVKTRRDHINHLKRLPRPEK